MPQKKITKLTPPQEAILPRVRDEWLAHGLSTEPAERAAAEAGVHAAYRAAGLQPPRFIIWLDSPWSGTVGQAVAPEIVAAALHRAARGSQVAGQVYGQVDGQVDGQVAGQVAGQVYGQVDGQVDGQVAGQVYGQVYGQVDGQVAGQVYGQVDGQVRDQSYKDRLLGWWRSRLLGQHSAGWYAYLDAMERIGVTGLEPIHGQQQVARSAGWWWAFRDFAIITDRPAELHRDPQGRLHCESGPAILYRDGWGFHAWHGTRVPEWAVREPTVARIAAETNQEVRRCAIESMGWDRFVAAAQLTPVDACDDPGNPGQSIALYDVPERLWGERVRVLLAVNGTVERDGTRRRFGLTVPPDVPTAMAAGGWTYGLTAEQYATALRRS